MRLFFPSINQCAALGDADESVNDGASPGLRGRPAALRLKFTFSCLWLIRKGNSLPFTLLSEVISGVPGSVGARAGFRPLSLRAPVTFPREMVDSHVRSPHQASLLGGAYTVLGVSFRLPKPGS